MDEGKGEQSLFNLDETTNVKRNVISGGQQERGHTHTRSQGAIKPATIRRKRLEDKLNSDIFYQSPKLLIKHPIKPEKCGAAPPVGRVEQRGAALGGPLKVKQSIPCSSPHVYVSCCELVLFSSLSSFTGASNSAGGRRCCVEPAGNKTCLDTI